MCNLLQAKISESRFGVLQTYRCHLAVHRYNYHTEHWYTDLDMMCVRRDSHCRVVKHSSRMYSVKMVHMLLLYLKLQKKCPRLVVHGPHSFPQPDFPTAQRILSGYEGHSRNQPKGGLSYHQCSTKTRLSDHLGQFILTKSPEASSKSFTFCILY